MKKTKVLFAVDRMNIGGAPAVVFGQMKGMNKDKFEIYLATLYPSKKANLFSQIDFIPKENIKNFNLRNRSLLDFKTWWQIYKFMKVEKFDVVYTHLFLPNVIFRVLAILLRVPSIIICEHSAYYNKNRWQIVVDNILSRWTKVILVPADSVADFTARQEDISIDKFRTTFYPVIIPNKESLNVAALKKEFGIPDDAFVAINIGRFSEEKGQKHLVEAAAKIMSRLPKLYVLIIGHGALGKTLAAQINNLGIGDRCKLLWEPERAKDFFYLADIFVLPSWREGQSIVTYEALTVGVPVVSFDIPSIKKIIKDGKNGLFVKMKDETELAEAIEKLYLDKELLSVMSKKGKESVKKYSFEDNLRKIENLMLGQENEDMPLISGFPEELLDVVLCPKDNGGLALEDGAMKCEKCDQVYKIEEGILDLLTPSTLGDIEKKEVLARDKEAAIYDERMKVRYYKEVVPTLKGLASLKGKKVIEYGAGTGRFSEIIAKDSKLLLAIDFSRESLNVLAKKISKNKNVGLVLADATKIKTKDNYFDKALAAQLMEHIPRKEDRFRFLSNINRTLRVGGSLFLSVYHHDLRRRKRGKIKEGSHKNGIFFKYFTKKDFTKELSLVFRNTKIKFIDNYLPFEYKMNIPHFIGGYVSRVSSSIWGLQLFSHLIGARVTSELPEYRYPSIFFKKKWAWFTNPINVVGFDMVNFFSYEKVDLEGFKRKDGITSIINLEKDTEDLWEAMRKSFIRKQIEKGRANGIIVKIDNNFKGFKKVYKSFRKGKNIPSDSIGVFRKNGTLVSAYYKGQYIAGGVFIENQDNIRAWILASIRLGGLDGKTKEIVGQANRMIIWEAMMYAKSKGIKKFDLGGMNLDSDKKEDKNLAEFKEAFGGDRAPAYYYHKIYSSLLKWWVKMRK